MMKVVTCASYYGSGSSAITDLMAEYSSMVLKTNHEFRLLHDIDGVSDLEFHLTECQNRHNSGHSLKRFIRLAKFFSSTKISKKYETLFNNKFLLLTNSYVKSLVDFTYHGWWFYDLYDKGKAYYFIKQLQNHFFKRFGKKGNKILKKEITYCSSPSKERFLEATRDYTSALFRAANPNDDKYLVLDQLVPSQNIERIMRYFKDEVYVFVVNRDPRDLYLCEMLSWHDCVIPHDPHLFCDWYRYTHSMSKKVDDRHIIYVNFEDLIYNYKETVHNVETILGLDSQQHIKQFSFFNPKRSIINTQIFRKNSSYSDAIRIIEKELTDYLYDFDSDKEKAIEGITCSDKSIF